MGIIKRCAWVTEDPLYIAYHDEEWGKPVYDDRRLFEMLILEGAQAGLSWLTVLKRREGYRTCFDQFDASKIAQYNAEKIASLLQDSRIIRNRLKIEATICNAKAVMNLQAAGQTFSDFLWGYVNGKPIVNNWQTFAEVPTRTPLSDRLSKDLKQRGFKFVGSTICYAFMQAIGMVNDHTMDCHFEKVS